jgi:hypothetical protein
MINHTRLKVPKIHQSKINRLFKRLDEYDKKLKYVALLHTDYQQHAFCIEAKSQQELLKRLRELP